MCHPHGSTAFQRTLDGWQKLPLWTAIKSNSVGPPRTHSAGRRHFACSEVHCSKLLVEVRPVTDVENSYLRSRKPTISPTALRTHPDPNSARLYSELWTDGQLIIREVVLDGSTARRLDAGLEPGLLGKVRCVEYRWAAVVISVRGSLLKSLL